MSGVGGDHIPGGALSPAMLAAGRRRIVAADSTKVGVGSVARFWDAAAVDLLVTEETSDPTVLADLRSAGVKIETVR